MKILWYNWRIGNQSEIYRGRIGAGGGAAAGRTTSTDPLLRFSPYWFVVPAGNVTKAPEESVPTHNCYCFTYISVPTNRARHQLKCAATPDALFAIGMRHNARTSGPIAVMMNHY